MPGLKKFQLPAQRMVPPPPPDMRLAQVPMPQGLGVGVTGPQPPLPPPPPVMQSLTPVMDMPVAEGIPQAAIAGPQPAQTPAAPAVDPYAAQYTAMYKALNPPISLGEQEMGKLQQARNSMLDTALNSGLTKQERAEAKVGGIFTDIIAPIAGLLGGNGTAAGALSFINQEKSDLALKKAQGRANQTAAFSALKGLYDIYGKVDPESLQQHGLQMSKTLSALKNESDAAAKTATAANNEQKARDIRADYESKKSLRDAQIAKLDAETKDLPANSTAKRDAESALAGLHKQQEEAARITNETLGKLGEAKVKLTEAQAAATPITAAAHALNAKTGAATGEATVKFLQGPKSDLEKAKILEATAKGQEKTLEAAAMAQRAQQRAAESGTLYGVAPPKGHEKDYAKTIADTMKLSDDDLKRWAKDAERGAAIGIPAAMADDVVQIKQWLRHYKAHHFAE